MKRLWVTIAVLVVLLPMLTLAGGFKQLTASQQFDATHNVPDTTTNAPYVEADSVNVTVVYQDGTPATTLDSVWYNSGDAQATTINDQLYFFDAWDDMNGAEGVGIYTVTLRWLNGTGSTFDYQEVYTVYQTTMSLEQQSDSLQATLDTAQAIMARLINTQDSIQAALDSANSQALWVAREATVAAIALTGTNITTIAESRTLTDGTETNTFAATQVHDEIHYQVAEGGTGTNLNINFYLEFDIGPNTKAASVVYHGRLDEGSPQSSNDTIHVWVYDWVGTSWTHINAPNGDFIGINGSSVADDETFEAQLVDINYVGTGANVGLVRIAFSNYDPDGAAASNLEETTELFLDYVFLEYQSLLTAQAIWEHDSAQMVLDSTFAVLDTLQLHDDWVAQNSSFDTLKYGGMVWVDDGANTNTVVGTDGIPTNPVGTIAAAKTIADLIGVKTIAFIEGTNEVIGETMEHYEFIGIGTTHDVTIDLGDQDLDGSKFISVYLTGTQAGSDYICADRCVLDGVDSLEIHAHGCAIVGPISVRGGDSYFNQCYSTVAGSGTPDLDFDGDAAVINISVRHYSGGLQLLGMTSDHTISYEADGQLIINADCISGTVVARGNMTITNDGTTMNVDDDAVFSRQDSGEWVPTDTNASGEVLGTMPDDWNAADSAGFQGAAGALDSTAVAGAAQQALEDVGYNSADSTLDLTQILIVASGNNSAIDVTGSGTGEGLTVTGGTTGNGIDVVGGSSTGHGINITTTTGDGIRSRPTGGDGMDLAGDGGSSAGLRAFGPVGDYFGTIVIVDTLTDGEQVAFMPDDWATADSTAYQGGAAGLDSTAVYGAVEQLIADSGVTRMDSTQRWVITGLAIDGANSTEGSFSVVNDDGNAVVFDASAHATAGGLVVRGGNLDYGIHAIGGAMGIRAQANAVDGGAGIGALGFGSGPGVGFIGGTTGHGLLGQGGSTSGAGMRLTGPGDATNSSYGMYVTGEDTAIYVVGGNAHIEPPWNDLGSGPDTIVLYFNDTSGTDTPIGLVRFSIKNSVGTEIAGGSSDMATGTETVHLTDGSYTVVAAKDGYIYESFALTASGNDDSVEVAGYNRIIGSAGVDSVCRVYGYISKGFDSVDARSVSVTATLPTDTYDSCANTIIYDRIKATRSNANGYWFLDLIFSSCLNNEMYQFTFEKKGIEPFTRSLTVPDSVSHQVTWGD